MAYNPNVPATGSTPAKDFTAMQGNNAQMDTSFTINHFALGSSGANEGFHSQIQIPSVIGDPNQAAPIISMYTKTVNGLSELFFQNGNLAADAKQMTSGNVMATANGESFLPGGVGIKWGQTNLPGPGALAFLYSSLGLSNFNVNTWNVILTGTGTPAFFNATVLATTGFTINASQNPGGNVFFVAIGQ